MADKIKDIVQSVYEKLQEVLACYPDKKMKDTRKKYFQDTKKKYGARIKVHRRPRLDREGYYYVE